MADSGLTLVGLRCAFPVGCACALCWSPWRGLGAKTRLSRLVLNFLPSAPADFPSRLVGLLAAAGLEESEVWQRCLRRPTRRYLPTPPPFLPPASSSSRHLLTRRSSQQLPAPAPSRSRSLAAPSAPSRIAFSGSYMAGLPTPGLGRGSQAAEGQAGEGGG